MNDRDSVVELLRQMLDGDDIATADWVCAELDGEAATRKPPGSPYSIADVAWHTWLWVHIWNTRIKGESDPFAGYANDWSDVAPAEWASVRDRLLAALHESAELAATADLDRTSESGRTAGQNLLQTALHTAYHLGQMALIRHELGLWPPEGE